MDRHYHDGPVDCKEQCKNEEKKATIIGWWACIMAWWAADKTEERLPL